MLLLLLLRMLLRGCCCCSLLLLLLLLLSGCCCCCCCCCCCRLLLLLRCQTNTMAASSVVLVTGGASPLSQAIAAALRASGAVVRLTHRPAAADERSAGGVPADSIACALGPDADTDRLVSGVGQIVHVEPVLPQDQGNGSGCWLDVATAASYNLLYAGCEAGVVSCCVVSSMRLFSDYSSELEVSSFFEPLPDCTPDVLGPHLAEFVCKQFSHSGSMRVTIARIGALDGASDARWHSSTESVAGRVAELVADDASVDEEVAGDGAQAPSNIYHPRERRLTQVHLATTNASAAESDYVNRWDSADAAAEAGNSDATAAGGGGDAVRRVLILGAQGMLGPDVARELAAEGSGFERLLLTDVVASPSLRDEAQVQRTRDLQAGELGGGTAAIPAKLPQGFDTTAAASGNVISEYQEVNIADAEGVLAASADVDATVVCAVVREHRERAFDVNVRGCYNAILAAVRAGHRRFVNTGPMACLVGARKRLFGAILY
jgi:nucleoside-diphosphate-sugar epimerase